MDGVAIRASDHSSIEILVELSKDIQSAKQVPLFRRDEKTDLLIAVLINGTSSHIFDYDDTHLDAIHHPSGSVAQVD